MRKDRFFLENTAISPGTVTIQDIEVVKQLRKVLRAEIGDEIEVCDSSGLCYEATITNFVDEVLEVRCEKKIEVKEPVSKIHIVVAVLKKANFEWVVEKTTELGVASITPIITKHTVKQNLDIDRLKKIAKEASEQSKRHVLPVINEIVSLEDFLSKTKGKILIADMDASVLSTKDTSTEDVFILIGPEGGWSSEEKELMKSHQFISFGPRPLRGETAAIVAVSRFQQAISDSQDMR